MVNRLRSLADTLDKATPGVWSYTSSYSGIESHTDGDDEGTLIVDYVCYNGGEYENNANAICVGRNECPSALREAADEIEILRRIAKVMADYIVYGDNPNAAIANAHEYLGIADKKKEEQ